MYWLLIAIFYFLTLTMCSVQQQDAETKPIYDELSEEAQRLPENATLSFDLATGLEVSLFASEPMITNPTNIDVDHRGRIWMCEVQNYRLPYNPTYDPRPKGDRILILEDTDHDGVADEKKVFYEGNDINGALGIAVLGDRIIVSSSPNVLIFYDEDQDDIPEKKDTLFSLIRGIDDDHGTHAFVFGPDGRLYFNFGNAGTQIRDKNGQPITDKFGRVVEAHGNPYREGMAFRCNIDGSELEVLGYNFRNIFELCVDSYGNVFQSDNDDDGNRGVRINHIIEYGNYGYKDQLTGAGWRERRVGMHEEIPLRHWHVNDPGVIPNMLMTGAGSPAGITMYEGSMLTDPFRGQIIHAEPGHQVVRAYQTQKDGAGYRATIQNIMKSRDKWFRPSDVCVAPDGSLFVADWHDAVVGGNGMDDRERGRIYRIAVKSSQNSYEIPKINLESPDRAIAALMSPNQATRYLAWTTLKTEGMSAEPALLSLFERSDPIATVRSLWLLAQLPQKGLSYVSSICQDGNEDLRIAAIRMMRYLYPEELLTQLRSMTNDPSPHVRKEIAVALTGSCDDLAIQIWLELTNRFDPADRWSLEAIGLPSDFCPDQYFNAWISHNEDSWNTPRGRSIIWRIRSEGTIQYLKDIISDPATSETEMAKYFRSFHFIDSRKKDPAIAEILEEHSEDTTMLKYALLSMDPGYIRRNRKVRNLVLKNLDEIKGSPEWFTCIKNLNLKTQNEALWSMIIDPGHDTEVKKDAAAALIQIAGLNFIRGKFRALSSDNYEKCVSLFGNNANPAMASFLISEISRKDIAIATKRRIVDALGNSGNGQQAIYQHIKQNKMPQELLLASAVKLLNCWNSTIRSEAPAILASIPGANLGQEPDIFTLSRKTGNIENGRKVYTANCSNCHQVNGEGIRFGPDLSEIGDKLSRRGLYQAIFYPSAGVSFGFEGINITLNNGDVFQGYIESKTDDAVQLRIQSGQSVIIKNSDIKSRVDLDQSLMTEGLFRTFSQEELVDLVTYLQTLKKSEPDI